MSFTDDEHARSVAIFHRRAELDRDLDPIDPARDLLRGLDEAGHVQVFVAVFFIRMSKVAALQKRTGTT